MDRIKNRTELHCHSYYSLLDGLPSPTQIIQDAISKGMTSIALTDHGFLGGMAEFFSEAYKNNIKPIYGIEMYETINTLNKDKNNKYFHLLVLCKNNNGMRGVNRLVKRSYLKENFYFKPRIQIEWLIPFAKDIIVSTACMQGRINQLSTLEDKIDFVSNMKDNFPNFYIELQSHTSEDQITINKQLVSIAQKTKTPIIITCDAHMLNDNDLELHGRFKAIVNNSKRSPDEIGEIYKDCYIQTIDDIYEKMSYLPIDIINEGIENTNLIAEQCNVEMKFHDMKFPETTIPPQYKNVRAFIEARVDEGWITRGYDKQSLERQKEARDRIKYELDVIENKGYLDYFAIVDDFLHYNNSMGYLPPKGRGCFTKDALVVTETELKTLDKVKIGDKVICADGTFNKVIDTFIYEINEDMVEFEYQKQGSSKKKYKNICTKDHKVLIYRKGTQQYVQAQDLKKKDLLCCPKINNNQYDDIIIDLVKYNYNNFKYDNNYIYEEVNTNLGYKYSPRWLEKNKIVSGAFAKQIINGYIPQQSRSIKMLQNLLSNTPFKTVKQYQKYCKKHSKIYRKIKRYIKISYLENIFIGLMYGDGFTCKAGNRIGLAINSTSQKDKFNRYVFYKFAEKIGIDRNDIYECVSKNKNLTQLYINSTIIAQWIMTDYFISKKDRDKIFNPYLLKQNIKCIKGLHCGLLKADGSLDKEGKNKLSFDNTSLSLINAYKILSNKLRYEPCALDVRLSHNNKKYIDKESYKARTLLDRKQGIIFEDENYWYLPITKVNIIKNYIGKVYDLHIENNHSYMINNIIVHNSCGGCLIAYFMCIHDIDPLEYDLMFERFLNPDPKDNHIPDIDVDFIHTARQDVVDYCTKKYGESKVCNIGLYSYIKAKTAIKDVGKSLEVPYMVTNEIAKEISDKTNLAQFIINNEHQKWIDKYSKFPIKEMFEIGAKLQGIPKSFGSHPSGKIICNVILEEEMGMAIVDGENVCMYDMHYVEDLGYVKFDFLGLKTNTVIYETLKLIGKNVSFISSSNINFNDDKVYEQFRLGNTSGIFQFSSYGMREVLNKMQSDCLEDLIACNALFRPGAMDYIDDFCHNKQHPEDIKFVHESLNNILGVTYGQLVYQEQMMLIGKMANVPSVDDLRRACGKKKIDLMKQQEVYLKDGLLAKGWTQEQVDTIWEQIVLFASYSFNKSHATAYAVLAYITMYLKVYYPVEFMTALLNTYSDDNQLVSKYIAEAQRMGIIVKVPNINKSDSDFKVSGDCILFGLSKLKDCGDVFVSKVIEERNLNGLYKNFTDFYIRTQPDKASTVSLIKAGAFGTKNREKFLLKYIDILFEKKEYKPVKSLPTLKELEEKWGIKTDSKEDRLKYYNAKRKIIFDEEQLQKHDKHIKELKDKYMQNPEMWEYDVMSMFITYNPLSKYNKYIRYFEDIEDGQEAVLLGVIASIQKKVDKNKKQFAFLDIYQNGDLVEVICWHSTFKEYMNLIARGRVVVIKGKKDNDKLVAKEMKTLKQWKQQKGII